MNEAIYFLLGCGMTAVWLHYLFDRSQRKFKQKYRADMAAMYSHISTLQSALFEEYARPDRETLKPIRARRKDVKIHN